MSSIENQTLKDFEVIVVDNSSTDETCNIINKFDKLNISKHTVKNNDIIAISRNIGMANSKGKWIAFLDADDCWKPKKLEILKKQILNNKKAILFSHDEEHYNNGKLCKILNKKPPISNIYHSLLIHGNCLSTSAVCLKNLEKIKNPGFSEKKEFITVEDYEFWIRLAKKGDFHFIDKVLGEWHTHGNNYSKNVKIHANALIAVITFHMKNYLNENPKKLRLFNHVLSKNNMIAARILQQGGEFTLSRKFLS